MKTIKHIICLLCMMASCTGVFGQGYGMYLNGEAIHLHDGDEVTFSEDVASGATKVTFSRRYGVVTVYEGGNISFFGNIERYFQNMLSAMHLIGVLGNNSPHYDWGYGSLMVIRDAMTADVGRPKNYNHFSYWSSNRFQGNNYEYAQYCWKYYQTAVDRTNELIRALRQIKDMNDVQRGYLATAYAFRALFYLDMVRMWEFLPNDATYPVSLFGKDVTNLTVPIVTEEDEKDPTSGVYPWAKKFRASRDEAFAFIQSDLDNAEADIEKSGLDTKAVPDLAAVYGLKARLYMWVEDYTKAQYWAEKAIATGIHHPLVESEIVDVNNGFNCLGPTSWIWGAQPTENPSGILCWTSWMSNETTFGYTTVCNVRISPYLYNKIGKGDVRKQLFKVTGDEPSILKYNEYYYFTELMPYSSLKFRPYSGECGDYSVGGLGAFPIMRIEEMHLIRAEAMAQQGNVADAQNLLNYFVKTFRDPNYSFTTTSKEQLIDEIFLQKQIELWGEGQIFFDYKRLNKPVDRVSHKEDDGFWEEMDRLQSTTRPAWMNFVFPRTMTMANLYNNPDPSGLYHIGGGVEHRDQVAASVYFIDGIMAEAFGLNHIPEVQQLEITGTGEMGYATIQKPFAYLAGLVDGLEVGDGGTLKLGISGNEATIPYQDTGLTFNGMKVYVSSTAKGTIDSAVTFPRNSIKVEYGNELIVCNSIGQLTVSFVWNDLNVPEYSSVDFSDFYYSEDYEPATLVTENDQLYFKVPYTLPDGCSIKYYIGQLGEDYYSRQDSIYKRLRSEAGFGICSSESGYAMIPVEISTDFSTVNVYPIYYIVIYDGIAIGKSYYTIGMCDGFVSSNYVYVDYSQDNVFHNQYTFGPLTERGYGVVVDAGMSTESVKTAFKAGTLEGLKEFPINHTNVPQTETLDGPKKNGTYRVALISVYQNEPIYVEVSSEFEINNDWTKWQPWGKGTGSYTYCNVWLGTDTGVPIFYRESLIPGSTMAQFRIDNWGGGKSLYIDYDKATNQCYIAEQYTGADYAEGDGIYAADIPTWKGDESLRVPGNDSYYDPVAGLFVLRMCYYCSAGYFGYDPEYFQCNGFYIPDYNVYMNYKGAYKDTKNKTGAIVSFAKGVDVASYKYVVLEGKYSAEQAEQIAAAIDADEKGELGAIESAEEGTKLLELSSNGDYTVATANYDAYGKLVGGNICSFTYEAQGGAKWESLGICKFTEDMVGPLFGADPISYDVEVRTNADKPGIYRMVNPYGAAFPYNGEGDYDASQDYFIDINAADPDGVYIEEQAAGFDWGYGPASLMSYGAYYMMNGYDFETVKASGLMGTLKDNVISFPAGGILLDMGGSVYQGNKNGLWSLNLNPANAKTRAAKVHVSISKSLKAEKSDLKMPEFRKAINVHVYKISSEQAWKGLQLRKDVKL